MHFHWYTKKFCMLFLYTNENAVIRFHFHSFPNKTVRKCLSPLMLSKNVSAPHFSWSPYSNEGILIKNVSNPSSIKKEKNGLVWSETWFGKCLGKKLSPSFFQDHLNHPKSRISRYFDQEVNPELKLLPDPSVI